MSNTIATKLTIDGIDEVTNLKNQLQDIKALLEDISKIIDSHDGQWDIKYSTAAVNISFQSS